jgi:hypothetical protein
MQIRRVSIHAIFQSQINGIGEKSSEKVKNFHNLNLRAMLRMESVKKGEI